MRDDVTEVEEEEMAAEEAQAEEPPAPELPPLMIKSPVVLCETGYEDTPEDAPFGYIIGRNGAFLRKRTGIVEALVPAPRVPDLEVVVPWAELNVSKFPLDQFARIVNFFQWVHDTHKTEAVVILFYAPDTEEWRTVVPEQVIRTATVRYKDGIQLPGFVRAGTIHSHNHMHAFHSGGDHADEVHSDGLHATIGELDEPYPTISIEIAVNGHRFPKMPEEYFHGVTMKTFETVVQVKKTTPIYKEVPISSVHRSPTLKKGTAKRVRTSERKQGTTVGSLLHQAARSLIAPTTPRSVSRSSSLPAKPTTSKKWIRNEIEWVPQVRKVTGMHYAFEEGQSLEDFPFPEAWKEQLKKPEPVVRVVTPSRVKPAGGYAASGVRGSSSGRARHVPDTLMPEEDFESMLNRHGPPTPSNPTGIVGGVRPQTPSSFVGRPSPEQIDRDLAESIRRADEAIEQASGLFSPSGSLGQMDTDPGTFMQSRWDDDAQHEEIDWGDDELESIEDSDGRTPVGRMTEDEIDDILDGLEAQNSARRRL